MKNILKFKIEYILIDLNYILLMKSSEFKIPVYIKSYDEKTVENYRNCYVAEKAYSLQTIKDIDPKFQ